MARRGNDREAKQEQAENAVLECSQQLALIHRNRLYIFKSLTAAILPETESGTSKARVKRAAPCLSGPRAGLASPAAAEGCDRQNRRPLPPGRRRPDGAPLRNGLLCFGFAALSFRRSVRSGPIRGLLSALRFGFAGQALRSLLPGLAALGAAVRFQAGLSPPRCARSGLLAPFEPGFLPDCSGLACADAACRSSDCGFRSGSRFPPGLPPGLPPGRPPGCPAGLPPGLSSRNRRGGRPRPRPFRGAISGWKSVTALPSPSTMTSRWPTWARTAASFS